MNTDCKGCRALEFIDDGIRRGSIMDIKLSEPRYNCALGQNIILIDKRPCCKDGECKHKTIRRSK